METAVFDTNQNYKKNPKGFAPNMRVRSAFFTWIGLLLGACIGDEPPEHFGSFCDPASESCLDIFIKPPFGFGSHTLLFYSHKQSDSLHRKLLFQTELYNDGAWLTSFNIKVDWIGKETVQLRLWGGEQDSVFYQINLGDSYTWKRILPYPR